jgi:hypothetical protein
VLEQSGVGPVDREDQRNSLGGSEAGRNPPVGVQHVGPGCQFLASCRSKGTLDATQGEPTDRRSQRRSDAVVSGDHVADGPGHPDAVDWNTVNLGLSTLVTWSDDAH